jgi:hypothetical protein
MNRTSFLRWVLLLGVLATVSCARPAAAPSGQTGGSPTAGGPLTAQEIKLGDAINGITCDKSESVLFHIHPHLAIYANGQAVQVPYGIGIGQPQHVAQTRDGPFVDGGSCFAWLHTHTQDGIIHIEAPIQRTFTLGDFFAVWGHRLSASQVGSHHGQVFAYVNGEKVSGDPAAIPLANHDVIQLNVGSDSPPPQPYTFPPNV